MTGTGGNRLFSRNFFLLWQGQLVSQIGSQAFLIAVLYWAKEVSDSATRMGLLMMVFSAPIVFLGPLGGVFADRHSRKQIIVGGDAVRGVIMLGLGAVFWLGHPESVSAWVWLFSAVASNGIVSAAFNPAVSAAIPDLVPRKSVASANSLNQLSVQGAGVIGQAVGGIAYAWLGAPVLFLVNGFSYLFSALSELFLRFPEPERADALHPFRMAAYFADARGALGYVWQREGMASFFGTATAINFLFMPVMILFPFYTSDVLGKGPEWYGFLLASISAGSVTGLAFRGLVRLPGERRMRISCVLLVVTTLLIAAFGLTRQPWMALFLGFGVGALTAVINVLVITLVQLAVPEEMRGRVIGVLQMLAGAATPLGMALGGLVGDAVGGDVSIVYLWAGSIATALVLVASATPGFRYFLATDIVQ